MGNLSFDVTREELIEAFSAAGRVVDAKVPTDRETGRPRGFAFVEFESDEAALRLASSSLQRAGPQGPPPARERGREPAAPAPGRARFLFEAGARRRRRVLPPRRRRVLPPREWRWRLPAGWWGGGGGGYSRPGGGGGYSRPGAPTFPTPEETGDTRGRRFRQKPETKPARKTSPRRRKDDIVEPDDEY